MPMPSMMPTPTPPEIRSTEQRLLVALLATADRGVAFQPPPGIDDARILALARHHRLSPLLAIGSRPAGFSPEIAEIFRRARLSTLGRSALLRMRYMSANAIDGPPLGIDVAQFDLIGQF